MKYKEELFVKASINVMVMQPGSKVPYDFGTGCIVNYKGRQFFLSVSHVTKRGFDIYVEPNQPHDGKTSPLYSIGGIVSYDYIITNENMTSEELVESIENGPIKIDVSFAEILTPMDMLQNEIQFTGFTVPPGKKIFLDLEHNAEPDSQNAYGFFGYIHQEMNGLYLKREPGLKAPLTYHRTDGEFYIFKAKKTIKNREEYAGTSGAPILDFEGRLVALACMVRPGTNMIYGFSIKECIYLLDLTLSTPYLQ